MANMIINALNAVLNGIGTAIVTILAILPNSPFDALYNQSLDLSWFKYFNWIFPISEMLAIFAGWLSAVAIYYGLSIVMRWIKAIE